MKLSRFSFFKKVIIGFIIAIPIPVTILESICRSKSGRCKCSAFSINRQTAIEEKFYIDTYLPVERTFPVPNTKDTISFDSAWTEYGWKMEKRWGLCILEHKVKNKNLNFCVPFRTKLSNVNSYSFEMKQFSQTEDPYFDPGSLGLNRFNFGINSLIDTIRILITQRDTVSVFSDTLYFIKTVKTDKSK